MPEWLRLLLSPLTFIFRRALQPADAAILDRYRDEITNIEDRYKRSMSNIETRLNDCEQHNQECEKKNSELRSEIGILRQAMMQFQHLHLVGRITIDKNNIIIDANEDAAILCEILCDKLIGQKLYKIIPHRFRDRHDVAMREVIDGDRPLRTTPMDFYVLTGNGYEVPVTITLSSWGIADNIQFAAEMRRR